MSTKALRSVLQLLREDKYPALHAEALAEVDAIERAAKELQRLKPIDKATGLALGLMDNIARELP